MNERFEESNFSPIAVSSPLAATIRKLWGLIDSLASENIRLGKDLCQTNDRLLALEKAIAPKDDPPSNAIPMLEHGHIYRSLHPGIDDRLFIVCNGRDGFTAVRIYPDNTWHHPRTILWGTLKRIE